MKTFNNMLMTIIATTIIVGGGTYFYFNDKMSQQKTDFAKQVNELKDRVNSIEKTSETASSSTQTATTATAATTPQSTATVAATETPAAAATATEIDDGTVKEWQNYTNGVYNYSLKYPTNWDYKDTTATGAMNTMSFKPKNAKDCVFDITIQKSNVDYTITRVKKQYATGYTLKSKTTADLNGINFTVLNFESTDGKTKPTVYLYGEGESVYLFTGNHKDETTNTITSAIIKSFVITK